MDFFSLTINIRRKKMKKILTLFLVVGAFFLLFASTVQAAPYYVRFGDSVNHWAGWHNGTSDDNDDVVVTPNLSNNYTQPYDNTTAPGNYESYATISGSGQLTAVNIGYAKTGATLDAGSLFIDLGANSTWDYVLQPESHGNIIYQFSTPLSLNDSSGAYLLSNYFSGGLNPQDYREDHPVGISTAGTDTLGTFALTDFLGGEVGVNPWVDPAAAPADYVSFSNFSLNLEGQDFIIGFGPTCANDEIYETVNNPVPIPTSILLFGSGLVGLAGIKRRRR